MEEPSFPQGRAPHLAFFRFLRMNFRKKFNLRLRSGKLVLGERTLVMGVLNIPPDSFFDGGKFYAEEQAMEHAVEMERAGADLIDVGAESTRPGSQKISGEAELRRGPPGLGGRRPRVQIAISIAPPEAGGAGGSPDAGGESINNTSRLENNTRTAEVGAR